MSQSIYWSSYHVFFFLGFYTCNDVNIHVYVHNDIVVLCKNLGVEGSNSGVIRGQIFCFTVIIALSLLYQNELNILFPSEDSITHDCLHSAAAQGFNCLEEEHSLPQMTHYSPVYLLAFLVIKFDPYKTKN